MRPLIGLPGNLIIIMKYLSQYADVRDNNFNLLRFLAATLVIYTHSYYLTPGANLGMEPLNQLIGTSFGAVAVDVFFITSGYLISKSFMRRDNVIAFLYARVLRIFPALIIAVLFCVFIIGPIFTQLPLNDYFRDSSIYTFTLHNAALLGFDLEYGLPGVFKDLPHHTVNGSLWTLPWEVWLYISVAVFGTAGIFHNKKLLTGLAVLTMVLYLVNSNLELFEQRRVVRFLRLFAMFYAGVFFYINRSRIPLDWRIALGSAILPISLVNTPLFGYLFAPALAYLVFAFSYLPSGKIRNFNRFGDYSYGLYIYAFPVEQAVASLVPGVRPIPMFIIAFFVTLALSYLSWNLIERPALARKNTYVVLLAWLEKNGRLRRSTELLPCNSPSGSSESSEPEQQIKYSE